MACFKNDHKAPNNRVLYQTIPIKELLASEHGVCPRITKTTNERQQSIAV
jgi:hypothetical protein